MNRLLLHRIAVVLLFVMLVFRLYQLQLVRDDAQQVRSGVAELTNDYQQVRPQRGEIFAADGRTLLAESVPIFTASIRPTGLPPLDDSDLDPGEPRRDEVYAKLGQILEITSTLTISPAQVLDQSPLLRNDLVQGLGANVVAAGVRGGDSPASGSWLDLAVPPAKSMTALQIRDVYSDTVTLTSPIAQRVNIGDVTGYQTAVIKRDIPRDIALVLRENSNSLPGVVIERDWSRRYPLSGTISSFSHILGYVGRINECELVSRNAARTWLDGLTDSIGHAVKCGVVSKDVDPFQMMPSYLTEDRIGKDGIEGSYEAELRGQLGVNSVVIDALGRAVEAPQVRQPVADGNNIVLTIDTGFQQQVQQILQNWIDVSDQRRRGFSGVFEFKRNYPSIVSGVAVVSDIKTGRVLAMVSLPSYDDNIYVDTSRGDELTAILAPPTELMTETQRLGVLYNRATAFTYPAGSTLKQFDTVIALQDGVITPETQIYDPGKLLVQNRYNAAIQDPYVNANSRPNGWIDVRKALEVSSNIFFMSVVGGNKEQIVNLTPEEQTIDKPLGIDRFKAGLEMFGFGAPTGVQLPNEAGGVVPSPAWKSQNLNEEFTTGDLYNMAIGQGNLKVTPLQLNMAGAALASSGKLYEPQIVDRIVTSSGELVRTIEPTLKADLQSAPYNVNPQYFAVAREGMRQSVTVGANKAARFECSGLEIAGKTGTAEFGSLMTVPNPNGRGSIQVLRSHAWFVGFAPYDDPQIEVTVLVEGAGDMNDGSATIAVPAVTQIMQAYFGVTPPSPLPSACQQDLPGLPARQNFAPAEPVAPTDVDTGRGR